MCYMPYNLNLSKSVLVSFIIKLRNFIIIHYTLIKHVTLQAMDTAALLRLCSNIVSDMLAFPHLSFTEYVNQLIETENRRVAQAKQHCNNVALTTHRKCGSVETIQNDVALATQLNDDMLASQQINVVMATNPQNMDTASQHQAFVQSESTMEVENLSQSLKRKCALEHEILAILAKNWKPDCKDITLPLSQSANFKDSIQARPSEVRKQSSSNQHYQQAVINQYYQQVTGNQYNQQVTQPRDYQLSADSLAMEVGKIYDDSLRENKVSVAKEDRVTTPRQITESSQLWQKVDLNRIFLQNRSS